jgi:hypothetical protein
MPAKFIIKPYAQDGLKKVIVGRYHPAVNVRQTAKGASM